MLDKFWFVKSKFRNFLFEINFLKNVEITKCLQFAKEKFEPYSNINLERHSSEKKPLAI